MQHRALWRMCWPPADALEMHFSLPCCALFATMALAMEWK
jgi:hypothetical protein